MSKMEKATLLINLKKPGTGTTARAQNPTTSSKSDVAKPSVKATSKVAAKSATTKSQVASKTIVKKAVPASVKPLVETAASAPVKPTIKVAERPKVEKQVKIKKPKLVRDSFTIPKIEYLVLDELKQRAGKLASPSKKSELIRAGIKALAAMSDVALMAALAAVPVIKTGRPTKV